VYDSVRDRALLTYVLTVSHSSSAPRQRRGVYEDVGQLVAEEDLGVVGHGAHGLELDELGGDARPVGLRLAGSVVELGIGLGLLGSCVS
jgi:hypothetical protein